MKATLLFNRAVWFLLAVTQGKYYMYTYFESAVTFLPTPVYIRTWPAYPMSRRWMPYPRLLRTLTSVFLDEFFLKLTTSHLQGVLHSSCRRDLRVSCAWYARPSGRVRIIWWRFRFWVSIQMKAELSCSSVCYRVYWGSSNILSLRIKS